MIEALKPMLGGNLLFFLPVFALVALIAHGLYRRLWRWTGSRPALWLSLPVLSGLGGLAVLWLSDLFLTWRDPPEFSQTSAGEPMADLIFLPVFAVAMAGEALKHLDTVLLAGAIGAICCLVPGVMVVRRVGWLEGDG